MRMPVLLVLASLSAAPALAADPPLAGEWVVDVSSDPSVSRTQQMQLTLKADGSVEGIFYGGTIEGGRWKQDRGRLCANFRTHDGLGPYHTSVCLAGNTAKGQTWAEHRNFLFNWNATRPTVAP